MPGLPSTTSEIESPTGCTKQLMSVACRLTPAAELMRPAGMKPSCCACRKRRSQAARRSSGSAWARARATRTRTCSTVASLPLAYFSISVSRQISCSATPVTSLACSTRSCSVLDLHTVNDHYAPRQAGAREPIQLLAYPKLLGGGLLRRGFSDCGIGRVDSSQAGALQGIGNLGVPHAQRQLDRGVAFLGDGRGVGSVAQQQLHHRQAALHRRVGEGG